MPIPCDLLLTADLALTQNNAREIIANAAVAVTNGLVSAVGPADEIVPNHAPASTKTLGRAMILPGLVNAHCHSPMTLLRGFEDDLPLMDWLHKMWRVEARLTPEEVRCGAMLAFAEMLASGTTCVMDQYFMMNASADAAEEIGLRAVIGEGVLNHPTSSYTTFDGALEQVEALYDRLRDHPRIRPAMVMHGVYTSTPDMVVRCADWARERGALSTTHAAQPRAAAAPDGKSPVPYLAELGALGENALLTHCTAVDADDIRLLAETGTKVAHCPQSNMKLSSGAAPVSDMLEAGVCVGLGTDGAASNNDLDMFAEMTSAAHLQKLKTMDPTSLEAAAVLDMATRNGAACLGLAGPGRLEPGAPADLTVLDLEKPCMAPLHNPVSQAVYAASGGAVRMTMVAGETLYEDGRFTRIDYPALLEEVQSAVTSLFAKKP